MASSFSNKPEIGSSVGDRASDAVAQTKQKVAEFGSAAAEKIDQNRGAAASGLSSAARTLHERADQLPGGETVTNMAHTAADNLSAAADYVRDHNVDSMMAGVTSLVKRNPGPSLLVAAALGFLLGRTFTRD